MADLQAPFGTPIPSRRVGETAREVLTVLTGGGCHTASSLAAQLKASPALVDLALQVLIVGGRVEPVDPQPGCGPAAGAPTAGGCETCGLAAACVGTSGPTAAGLRRLRLVSRGR